MATKAQIARKMYGVSLSELSGGEKAAVTRAFNKQTVEAPVRRRAAPAQATATGDYLTVKFARPGVNGTKESVVNAGTTLGEALEQAGIKLNASKEGVVTKSTGAVVMIADKVIDGELYLIVPGVDSSIV